MRAAISSLDKWQPLEIQSTATVASQVNQQLSVLRGAIGRELVNLDMDSLVMQPTAELHFEERNRSRSAHSFCYELTRRIS